MFHKLAALTILLVALAVALLTFRQQRIEAAHHNAVKYQRIQQARQAVWDAESRAAALIRPDALQTRITRAQLALEPADPIMFEPAQRSASATPSH